jgi:hypothetical protein
MNRPKFINPILAFCFALLAMTSCTSNEIGNSKDVNPDAIFFDYSIIAEEDGQDVTVNLQYRMGGKNGTTLVLDEPSKVLLDGEQLKVDSAKLNGAYYEVQKPIASFAGKHTISFIDHDKKEYREEFEFVPFTLDPNVPAVIERGDLVFTFKGLEAVDVLSVTLTDTSFQSADIINDIDTVRDGRLVISENRLSSLVNGPINVQFYREVEKPVKSSTKEGGKLYMRYGVKREFELKDAVNL